MKARGMGISNELLVTRHFLAAIAAISAAAASLDLSGQHQSNGLESILGGVLAVGFLALAPSLLAVIGFRLRLESEPNQRPQHYWIIQLASLITVTVLLSSMAQIYISGL